MLASSLLLLALQAAAGDLPEIPIEIGGAVLTVEVASTPAERAQGLMGRLELPPDHGMLFVYPRPDLHAFWMKGTFIPLSIAFIDAEKRIVDIQDMAPLDAVTHHRSPVPVPYALEVPQGWFREHGVEVGARVSFELPEGLTTDPNGAR